MTFHALKAAGRSVYIQTTQDCSTDKMPKMCFNLVNWLNSVLQHQPSTSIYWWEVLLTIGIPIPNNSNQVDTTQKCHIRAKTFKRLDASKANKEDTSAKLTDPNVPCWTPINLPASWMFAKGESACT